MSIKNDIADPTGNQFKQSTIEIDRSIQNTNSQRRIIPKSENKKRESQAQDFGESLKVNPFNIEPPREETMKSESSSSEYCSK